ncbi:glutaredoxin family protein [Methanolacinia petrolearia]|uniref:glutaredoxin family protein n=1 Tax=Methanolacinia petrolearia TaxID=54120 RepID=UPI003BAB9AE3
MTEWTVVEGRDKGSIVLYALSTCIHCKKTKELLNELGVAYKYIFVDLLPEDELNIFYAEMKKYNPAGSFPTMVINGDKVIVGSRLEEIREALNGD